MIGRRLRRVFRTFRRGSTVPPTPSSYNVPSLPLNSPLAKAYGRHEQDFDPRFGKHDHITSSDTGVYHRVESRPVDVPRSPSGALDQNTSLYSSSDHAQSLGTGHPALRPRDSTIMPRSTAAYVGGAPRSSLTSTIVSSRNGGTSVPSDSVHFMNIAPQLGHPFRTPYPDTDRSGEVPTPGWFTGLFYDEGESVSSGSSYISIFDSLEDHMVDCHWGQQADSRADQRDNVESALSGPPLTSWFSFSDDSMESLSDTELILAEGDRRDAKFGLVDRPHPNPVILELEEGDVDDQTDNKVTEPYRTDATLLGNIVTHQVTPISGPTLPAHSTLALTDSIYTAPSSSVEPIKQQIRSHVPEPPGLDPLPFDPRPSLPNLGSRASDSVDDGLEGDLGDSSRSRLESTYNWGPQHPTLAPALNGTTHLDTAVTRDVSSETSSILNLHPDIPAPAHHVNSLDPSNDARSPLSKFPIELIHPDLGPCALDTASSNTTTHKHVATSRRDISCKHRGDLMDRPAASNHSLNLPEDCDKGHEPVDDCAIPPACTSAEETFQTEPHDQGDDRPHATPLPSEEPLVATTTTTWIYAASDPENGVIRAKGRRQPDEHCEITAFSTPRRGNDHKPKTSHPRHSARHFSPSSVDPKAVFKKPDIFHVPCLAGRGTNRGICTLPSSDRPYPNLPPRRRPSTSLGRILWVLSTGVELPWVMRLIMKHSQYITTAPMLPSTSFSICSCQRMFQTSQLLRVICPYAFSWDSGASGSAFHFGQTSGSNQTPGNTYPRLEDGSGIWSGQGPGPSVNVLSSQGPEFLGLASRFEDLFQALGDSIQGFPYDTSGGVATQPLHSAPNPPVPLRSDILRGLLFEAFSAGFDAGLSLGNTHTIQWETASNVFGSQQPNCLGGAQDAPTERVTSTLHHPAPDWSLGSSHDGGDWTSDLPLADLSALVYGESGPSEFQLPPGAQSQPTGAPSDAENTQDPVGEPPAPHIEFDKTIGLQDSKCLLLGNGCSPSDGTDSDTELGRPTDLSPRILPVHQAHPAQVVTTSNIGSKSPPSGSRPEQRGNEYKHQCNQCGQRFRRRYLLGDHIRAHDNEKPYVCTEGCGRRYANRSGMMRHLKQAHLQVANPRGVPLPGNEPTRGDTQEQIPQAGPSNGGMFRGNIRSLRPFVHYDPSTTRHKSRQRE